MLIGIDPGLAFTGFAVASVRARSSVIQAVKAVGIIRTSPDGEAAHKGADKYRRAEEIHRQLRAVIAEHAVQTVMFEMGVRSVTRYANFDFGLVYGLIAGLALPTIAVSPQEVKRAATGVSRASKGDVIKWALKLTRGCPGHWPTSQVPNSLGLKIGGKYVCSYAEHAADALAVIQAGVCSEEWLTAED
jgi:Holliday junction resolvasome RuvABC endonuclease subunit